MSARAGGASDQQQRPALTREVHGKRPEVPQSPGAEVELGAERQRDEHQVPRSTSRPGTSATTLGVGRSATRSAEAGPDRRHRRALAHELADQHAVPFATAFRAVQLDVHWRCVALASTSTNPAQAFTAALNTFAAQRRDSVFGLISDRALEVLLNLRGRS